MMLTPLAAAYGVVMRVRATLYRTGALASHKIEAPVISVGNITTGGSGKTPLVEWIAQKLYLEGRRTCVLTRGYGRANPQRRVVVSDGENILADARVGGDEPYLLAENLRRMAAIISDRDRVAAARWALKNLRVDTFILDDGFQHPRIKRDLDIVTIDATNPFGGESLLPQGRLREPLNSLARADCIIITRADLITNAEALGARVRELSGGRTVLLSKTRTTHIHPLLASKEKSSPDTKLSLPQPFAAFCALGNPQAFYAQLSRDQGVLSYTRSFRDHHVYTQKDVDALTHEAAASGAQALVTTAKDAVKLRELRFALPCYVVEITVEFDDETILLKLIHKAIGKASLID